MRHLTAIAGLILGGAALAATTCLVEIPELEEAPVAGSDAAAGSSAAGGSGGSGGGVGGTAAGGTGGALPSYRQIVMEDAPLAYWRLGEAAGGMAHDEMSQENDGTYRDVELGVAGAIGDEDTAARFHPESSLLIDDSDRLLEFTVSSSYSIEGWFFPEHQDQQDRRLLSSEPQLGDPSRGYGLIAREGEVRFFRARDGGVEFVGGGSVPLLQFAHIVGTYDGHDMCLYVNGSLVGSCADSNIYLSSFWRKLGVGMPLTGGNDTVHFIGIADELAVYAEALTGPQIEAHYQAGSR